jgi:hypothetical protein
LTERLFAADRNVFLLDLNGLFLGVAVELDTLVAVHTVKLSEDLVATTDQLLLIWFALTHKFYFIETFVFRIVENKTSAICV